MIRRNTKSPLELRQVLLTVQMLSLFISVLPGSVIQPFAVITYCLAVFTTPLLLIIYGHKYLGGAKDWSWEIVPLLAETLLSILFVGSMIYGVWFLDGNIFLFARLLIAYAVITVICALGYYAHCLKAKLNAMEIS